MIRTRIRAYLRKRESRRLKAIPEPPQHMREKWTALSYKVMAIHIRESTQ